jgi:polyisoprenyl-teichoic acid--peptidoglycan teichoic acid transferase
LKDKVNTAYHYGEEKKKGGGLILARATAEDVIGMPIYYGFLIDFQGFKTVIDTLGGVDVNVSQTFTDTQYPAPGKEHDSCPGDPTNACVYETIHFDAGMQLMNGDRALIYVRSRHADGAEGSDFARSRRQQEVLLALKNTLLHPTTWITFDRVRMLPKAFDEATDTNMSIGELATIGRLFLSIPEGAVKKISFESFLYDPPAYLYGGRSVLTPRDSWESIQEYVASQVQ